MVVDVDEMAINVRRMSMAVNNEIKFNKVYNLSQLFTRHTKQEQQQGIKKGYKATLNQVRYLCGGWGGFGCQLSGSPSCRL